MTIVDVAPIMAAVGFVASVLSLAAGSWTSRVASRVWMLPATLCAAFTLWTLYAVFDEGLLAVWNEISRNIWANQIWFDLLLAAGIALTFLIPEARRLGMRPVPWMIAVAGTGCIVLPAMLARSSTSATRTRKAGNRTP